MTRRRFQMYPTSISTKSSVTLDNTIKNEKKDFYSKKYHLYVCNHCKCCAAKVTIKNETAKKYLYISFKRKKILHQIGAVLQFVNIPQDCISKGMPNLQLRRLVVLK